MDEDPGEGCPFLLGNMILDDFVLGMTMNHFWKEFVHGKTTNRHDNGVDFCRHRDLLFLGKLVSIPFGDGHMGPRQDIPADLVPEKRT